MKRDKNIFLWMHDQMRIKWESFLQKHRSGNYCDVMWFTALFEVPFCNVSQK